ncbi:PREDICTED: zinc finger CCHC domain-containing protein 2-like [Priapulus caudatus]|uniref:Zinc finger CCHC domain-containing protein 2-like n=1 Tax=Priapulus caudatus TaxID=37621 RepID=A0ABM1E5K8_PRICU|nr:PREDICTED: zinc finger CCHC domain-containing protein 2-like [Priapulus caudatus]
MVYKEEVLSWFKDLPGAKRIDFMCRLVHFCVPLELRFFGTCVEDLAKRDFHYLRDLENKSNSASELTKLTDVTDCAMRSKLIITLTLLYSSNYTCSNLLFRTLTNLESVLDNLPKNEKVANELQLLFTLSTNHPAFTSEQKRAFNLLLEKVCRIYGSFLPAEHKKKVLSHHGKPEGKQRRSASESSSRSSVMSSPTRTPEKGRSESASVIAGRYNAKAK